MGCNGAEGGVGKLGGLHGMRRYCLEGTANAGLSDTASKSVSNHLSTSGLAAYKGTTRATVRAQIRRAGFQRPEEFETEPQIEAQTQAPSTYQSPAVSWMASSAPFPRPVDAQCAVPLPAFQSSASSQWAAPLPAPLPAFQSPAALQWAAPLPGLQTPVVYWAQGTKRTSEGLIEAPNSRPRIETPNLTPGAVAAGPMAHTAVVQAHGDLGAKLRDLKSFYDEGLMTEGEYTLAKRKALGLPC